MTADLALGLCFDRRLPPPFAIEVAQRLEEIGADSLWVIEDCFFTTGVPLAAAALARTERIEVGIGILPAVARNPAVTAMEFATLERLAPGRFVGGIGHGVQRWMAQMGVRARSPLTALEEAMVVVRRLLAGETVSYDGSTVTLDEVALDQPPQPPPPVLAGVRGPKSVALAGRVADGLVLAGGLGPTYTRWTIEQAAAPGPFRTSAFSTMCMTDDRTEAFALMAPSVARWLERPEESMRRHPHFDELVERHADGGVDALATMPVEWWLDIGAIGGVDEVVAHLEAMGEAGAAEVCLFPGDDVELVRSQLDDVATILAALGR